MLQTHLQLVRLHFIRLRQQQRWTLCLVEQPLLQLQYTHTKQRELCGKTIQKLE